MQLQHPDDPNQDWPLRNTDLGQAMSTLFMEIKEEERNKKRVMSDKKVLTVKEAIEQGYIGFCRDNDEQYFKLTDIPDMPDFGLHKWSLIDKEPTYLTVDAKDIYDDLFENFAINRDVYDDDDSFGNLIIEAVDWDEIATKINEKLKEKPVYYPTKINLIP